MTQVLETTDTAGAAFETSWAGMHTIFVAPAPGAGEDVKLQWQAPGGTDWYDYDHDTATDATFTAVGAKNVLLANSVIYRLNASASGPAGWVVPIWDGEAEFEPRGVTLVT